MSPDFDDCRVRLQPLIDALQDLLLAEPVLHADETPVPMLAPVKKKTHRLPLGLCHHMEGSEDAGSWFALVKEVAINGDLAPEGNARLWWQR